MLLVRGKFDLSGKDELFVPNGTALIAVIEDVFRGVDLVTPIFDW
jgi:hypothetical protein